MASDDRTSKLTFWDEVVDPHPLTISSQTLLPKVLAKLVAQPESSCILAMHRGRVSGIATRQDLMQAIVQRSTWTKLRLSKVMSRPVITVSRSELSTVASLVEQFERHQISHLPVLDERKTLIGVIVQKRLLLLSNLQSAEFQLNRQHQRAQLFAEITLKIRQSLQLKEILQTTVEEVQKLLDADRVLIYRVLPDSTGITISEAVKEAYPSVLGVAFPEEVFPEEYQRLYARGRVQAIADVHAPNSGLAECLVDFIQQWGIQSKLIVPIVHPLPSKQSIRHKSIQNHLWGLLIAHQCESPRQWTDFELELMQQLADQISIALSQGQTLEYLEDRVKLRTVELTQANIALQQEIQERKQVEMALRQSEEQIRLITNNLPVLIAYVDRQQCYCFNNQAYEYWLGQAPKELHGQSIQAVTPANYYKQIRPHIEAALQGHQVTYESELTFKDGRCHSVSVSYIPHLDVVATGETKINGFFALTSDISERKAIERMKDEFIAVVSHELRTPLTSLHGSLKLIATGRLGHLSEAGQQMLAVADESTDRLVRLVNNVLDLQRIEAGEVTMDACTCNAADLVEQAAEAMQPMAQEYDIEICRQLNPLSIWADPDYIVQTLTNLIGNAIKFSSPSKTITLKVESCSNLQQRSNLSDGLTDTDLSIPMSALFCVQDNGQGIPLDKLGSIFERFQQVDSSDSRKKGGTGLGLTICRKIIEQHGGRIWAESQVGIGSCFYFTVPLSHEQVLTPT
ncbi:multi-sensor signal transduction histidine kinase [Leptolyngbya sp. Heron Island J]|uniref:ATP-binding protein n=1 Tax=Leptolyngbya sp. Heron Island J TaxID=1385935 RepID=UPI0003B9E0A2|nr:ATP-binding protein [Leptolyngbya sp. Heron Island J]ESA32504.1 multi-sensor signal transduction histidine kinase [Leptolyngbya sp. Heron Island J]